MDPPIITTAPTVVSATATPAASTASVSRRGSSGATSDIFDGNGGLRRGGRDISERDGWLHDRTSLPRYLQVALDLLESTEADSSYDDDNDKSTSRVDVNTKKGSVHVCSLSRIPQLSNRQSQYVQLLLRRHWLCTLLADVGAAAALDAVLERAKVHEALGFPELAVGDGVVVLEICGALMGDGESELLAGSGWEEMDGDHDQGEVGDEDDNAVIHLKEKGERRTVERERLAVELKYQCLLVLYRCAIQLGCEGQAATWWEMAVETCKVVVWHGMNDEGVRNRVLADVKDVWGLYGQLDGGRSTMDHVQLANDAGRGKGMFGFSQRLIYPWNEHEPDRMSEASLKEINLKLREAAPDLEVRKSILPALKPAATKAETRDEKGDRKEPVPSPSVEQKHEWAQLGLFATSDLKPGSTILTERSALTAIRPHGEALCDACAADMEEVPQSERWSCPGCDIPFCSEACYSSAKSTYHCPNEDDDETDEGYPPSATPFCPGSSGHADINTFGRAESSATPEWDLCFLLLARTLQLAETQDVHPLDLFEIKYLWGDFTNTTTPSSSLPNPVSPSTTTGSATLPYSLHHHVELPLQWFETLMLSRAECTPYSAKWLQRYDWWVVQTLLAKFRGVADAQQSSWTGKPEIAAVHPLWCLANHSCNPSVTWKPTGVRNLTVMQERVWKGPEGAYHQQTWEGIKKGEQVWNHYTDVHDEDYRERRARLLEVLGGQCLCERCVFQEREDTEGGG